MDRAVSIILPGLRVPTVAVTSTDGGGHLVPTVFMAAVLNRERYFVYIERSLLLKASHLKTVDTKNTSRIKTAVATGIGGLTNFENFATSCLRTVE